MWVQRLIWPTSIGALLNDDPGALSQEENLTIFAALQTEIDAKTQDEIREIEAIAPTVLSAEISRRQGLEAKASAMVAVAGLIAAGLAIVISIGGVARYAGVPILIYLLLGTAAAIRALTPGRRHVLTVKSVMSESNPLTETLAVAKVNERPTLAMSNLVTSAAYDLARAGLILCVALAIAIFVPGH